MTNRHNFTLHDQYMMEQRDTLGLRKNDVITIQQQRREAMKREAEAKLTADTIAAIICVSIVCCIVLVIYMIAVATLPMLGGIAAIAAMSIIFWLQLRTILRN